MRNTIRRSLAVGSLLAFGLTFGALAQDRDSSWYQTREGFYHGDQWRARLFDRVREDVDHVQSKTFPVGKDEFRLVRTKQQLNELQDKMAAHRYDQPELDDVIGSLQRVVESNKLSARDRDVLNDDLQHLRDYREHHENWGRP